MATDQRSQSARTLYLRRQACRTLPPALESQLRAPARAILRDKFSTTMFWDLADDGQTGPPRFRSENTAGDCQGSRPRMQLPRPRASVYSCPSLFHKYNSNLWIVETPPGF